MNFKLIKREIIMGGPGVTGESCEEVLEVRL